MLEKIVRKVGVVAAVVAATVAPVATAFAEGATEGGSSPLGPIGAGLAIGSAVIGGALGQGRALGAMLESFGRNPSVGGKLLAPMLIGMALIESLVILAFVVALMAV